MRTAGVDLAAESKNTATACLSWSGGTASVETVVLGANDDHVVALAESVDKLGLDCPLGWPDAFVDFLVAHRASTVVAPTDVAGRDWRRRLANRRTDLAVRQQTGVTPLSVAADRIGLTAMRAAAILAALSSRGAPVDRTGRGVVVEVYPAAALKCWELAHRGYKGPGNTAALNDLVDALQAATPWLQWNGFDALCRISDDAFDAVVCALVARAAATGKVRPPSPEEVQIAETEGWIALPCSALGELSA